VVPAAPLVQVALTATVWVGSAETAAMVAMPPVSARRWQAVELVELVGLVEQAQLTVRRQVPDRPEPKLPMAWGRWSTVRSVLLDWEASVVRQALAAPLVPVDLAALPSAVRSIQLIPVHRERPVVLAVPVAPVVLVEPLATAAMVAPLPPVAMEPW
jgi:hypothetical protein